VLAVTVAAIPVIDAQARGGGHSGPSGPSGSSGSSGSSGGRSSFGGPSSSHSGHVTSSHNGSRHSSGQQGRVHRHEPKFTLSSSGRHNNAHCRRCGNRPQHDDSGSHVSSQQQGRGQHVFQAVLKQGPGKLLPPKSGIIKPTFPVIHAQNKFWPILKGPKFIWFAGQRHFFVPVGLLGVVLIGDAYWYPDGYVSIAGPLCSGFTPDGCQLAWRLVDFEDGGSAVQCVQYCRQSGPPPAHVVKLPPRPALVENGLCQVVIYGDADFHGLSGATSTSQPILSDTGWKDEISSIQVQSGTWDFFSDENFGGESIRMAAGNYPMLAPEWNRKIGSFMCVEPGSGGGS
jgi:hypothetical protein